MATQPEAAKSDYREVIRKRAEQLIREIADIDQGDLDKSLDRVTETLRQTALESWRNGIEAGRKKASAQGQAAFGSKQRPSALSSGRLQKR